MNKLLFWFLFIPLVLPAQKEGNVWFFGGADPTYADSAHFKSCRMNFEGDTQSIEFIPKILPFTRSNSSICDKEGNFFCLSNGENIYNRNYEVMDNGQDFYPNNDYSTGFPGTQGFMLLPFPGNDSLLIHFYGKFKVIYPNTAPQGALAYWLRYAIIDMRENNGLGKVMEKNIIGGSDTLEFTCLSAVRHGNGRDWWIMSADYRNNIYYKYLLDPSGVSMANSQHIAMKKTGIPQSVFSPNGQWYARFEWHGRLPDSTFSTIELYPFDRCTGELGSIQEKTYSTNPLDGKPGGVAFSASSRYMYVSRWDTIYQYDMLAPNILESEVVVASFDGFWGDWGNGFTVPQRFYSLMLGPDEKIYCCVSNYNSRYLHVINNPEAAGIACNVQQHTLELPVFNEYSVPNNPYYGLGRWEGSICDTIGMVRVNEPKEAKGLVLSPNPTTGRCIIVHREGVLLEGVEVFDTWGRRVLLRTGLQSDQVEVDLSESPSGVYYCVVRLEMGKLVVRQVVVVRE